MMRQSYRLLFEGMSYTDPSFFRTMGFLKFPSYCSNFLQYGIALTFFYKEDAKSSPYYKRFQTKIPSVRREGLRRKFHPLHACITPLPFLNKCKTFEVFLLTIGASFSADSKKFCRLLILDFFCIHL